MLTSDPHVSTHPQSATVPPPAEQQRTEQPPTEQVGSLTFRGYPCSYRLLRRPGARTEPFLLLGGALQDKYAWTTSSRTFGAVADIMTIDLPGWGDAPVLPAHYGFDFLADSLAAAMDHAGIARANLVGACYGALIAYALADRHPGRATQLVMVSAQDGLSDEARAGFHLAVDALRADDLDGFLDIVVDLYLPPHVTAADRRRKAIARVLRSQMRQLAPREFDNYVQGTLRLLAYEPRFDPLEIPTLVVNGEQDTFTPPSGGRQLAHRLDAAFSLIGGAGHMLGLERPVRTAEHITSFVTGALPGSFRPRREPQGTPQIVI